MSDEAEEQPEVVPPTAPTADIRKVTSLIGDLINYSYLLEYKLRCGQARETMSYGIGLLLGLWCAVDGEVPTWLWMFAFCYAWVGLMILFVTWRKGPKKTPTSTDKK